MKFGACIPHYGITASKKAVAEFGPLAESLGFDSVWSTDHLAVNKKHSDPYGEIFESLVTLSYVAARTEHAKLGTSIIVLPMRHPVLFAKQIASLDVLSDGRIIVGLGVGWMEDEFATLNSNFRERGRIMNEQMRLLRSLWTEDDPRFEGRFFKVADAVHSPKPVQKNGPPIWIGGSSPAAFKRAARFGDGWHPVGLWPNQIADGKRQIETLIGGKRKIVTSVRLPVELSATASNTYVMSSGEKGYMVGGTREGVVKELETLQQAGVEHLICFFGNKPYEYVASQATLFAKEVLPSFNQ